MLRWGDVVRKVYSASATVVSLVFFISFVPGLSAQPGDIEKNRQLVAKDYARRDDQLIAARIGLKRLQPSKERSWFPAIGAAQSATHVEVVALLKSGEELVIDRAPAEDIAALPPIYNTAGSLVGYFHHWATRDDAFNAARAAFILYLVGEHSLIRTTAEVRCQKIDSHGKPRLQVDNARWHEELRELEFTLRASCYHIELYGYGKGRILSMPSGKFEFDKAFAEVRPWTETSQTLVVTFDAFGESATFNVSKGDAAERRALVRCVEEANKGTTFRVCGDQAFWRKDGRVVKQTLCALYGTSLLGTSYVLRTCPGDDGTQQSQKRRWVYLQIANEQAHAGVDFELQCTCERLHIDRLRFDPQERTVSFNMDTDASTISVEGGEFNVQPIRSRLDETKATMLIPVFSVRFNEHWQVVGVTASQ